MVTSRVRRVGWTGAARAVGGCAVAIGMVATTSLAAGTAVASGAGTLVPAGSDEVGDGATKTVSYRDLSFEVPRSWPVYDLEQDPGTCVRFDRHAVYLGNPGTEQECPARAVGRTEALLVQPAGSDSGLGPDASLVAPDADPEVDPIAGTDKVARLAFSGTGLAVTATYLDRPGRIDAILDSVRYDGPVRKTILPSRQTAAAPHYPDGASGTRAHERGFDTCAAPSAKAMHAWKRSPYDAVGIYIGGLNRACGDGNLDAGWVRQVTSDGWHLIPIYVGRQAPCAFQGDLGSMSPDRATEQGRNAAADAIKRARHFDLHSGSAIYFDMEAYDDSQDSCRRAVLRFLDGWTKRLHDSGFLAGVYSSASSGIKNLADTYHSSRYTSPDVIWTARWDGKASVWGERYLGHNQWAEHQRMKQYRGPHTEEWGGYRINIDSDVIDAAVGTARFRYRVTAGASLHTRSGPSTRYDVTGSRAPGSRVEVMCQVTGQKIHSSRVWDKLHDGSYVSDYYVSTRSDSGYSKPVPRCTYPQQVTASLLHQRTGPGTSHSIKGAIPFGGLAYIVCQDRGEKVGGSRVWDKLTNGTWIADRYVESPGRPGFTEPIPRCP